MNVSGSSVLSHAMVLGLTDCVTISAVNENEVKGRLMGTYGVLIRTPPGCSGIDTSLGTPEGTRAVPVPVRCGALPVMAPAVAGGSQRRAGFTGPSGSRCLKSSPSPPPPAILSVVFPRTGAHPYHAALGLRQCRPEQLFLSNLFLFAALLPEYQWEESQLFGSRLE